MQTKTKSRQTQHPTLSGSRPGRQSQQAMNALFSDTFRLSHACTHTPSIVVDVLEAEEAVDRAVALLSTLCAQLA